MKKLNKLTAEQEALIPVIRDKWINRFNEGWVNKDSAEIQIKWLYQLCGMKEPKVWFVDSPMMAQIIANLLINKSLEDFVDSTGDNLRDNVRANVGANVWDNVGDNVWDNVGDNVWDNVWDNVGDNVGDNVRANVGANVGANVWDNVWDNVGDNVWDNVWDNVRANVGDNVGDNVRANVWDNVRANVGANVGDNVWDNVRANVGDNVIPQMKFQDFAAYGGYESYGWISFYDFFDKIGVELKNDNYIEFRKLLWSGIYDMIQFENVCIAVSLPAVINRNKGKLHSEDSPAITFRDGYSQWYWKGTYIPRHWIENKELITDEELKTDNVEKRRVLIDILGVSDYYKRLGGSGLKLLDEGLDNQGNPMKLFTFDFSGKDIQVLECTCPSTKRIYNLYPPNQKSRNIWDGKASVVGLSEEKM